MRYEGTSAAKLPLRASVGSGTAGKKVRRKKLYNLASAGVGINSSIVVCPSAAHAEGDKAEQGVLEWTTTTLTRDCMQRAVASLMCTAR